MLSRAGAGIRERMASLVGSKVRETVFLQVFFFLLILFFQEDTAPSPRSPRDDASPRPSRIGRQSFSASPSASPLSYDDGGGGGDCKVSVALPSGATTLLSLPRTCKVDQIKSRLWALVDELAPLAKEDFVLGDASGKRFEVEFQRLSRVDPSLEPRMEAGQIVELVLAPRTPAVVMAARGSPMMGGTPTLQRRKLGAGATKEAAFYTPQPVRKLATSPRQQFYGSGSGSGSAGGALSPRQQFYGNGVTVAKSPKSPRPVDELEKHRQTREAQLKEKEEALRLKKERLENERHDEERRKAAEALILETERKEEERRIRAEREAREADRNQIDRERERQTRARQAEEAAELERRRDEVIEQEARLREKREQLEEKLREKKKMSEEEAVERLERRREEAAQAEARIVAYERRQRELDLLASEASQSGSVVKADESLDDASLNEFAEASRRESVLLVERKKREVEEKRAELDRKMREVEERQAALERASREREEQEKKQQQHDEEEALKKRRDSRKQLESHNDEEFLQAKLMEQETVWGMLREKQMSEDARRKQLVEEKLEKTAKLKASVEEHDAQLAWMAQQRHAASAPVLVDRPSPSFERVIDTPSSPSPSGSMHLKPISRSNANPVVDDPPPPKIPLHEFGASSDSPISTPKSKKKAHNRSGSFGFLNKAERSTGSIGTVTNNTGNGGSSSGGGALLEEPKRAGSEKAKGTPLLSRISQGVKGVKSVLVQRRNSFRSAKPVNWKDGYSGPDDFPQRDEIADEDDALIAIVANEAMSRCSGDQEVEEESRRAQQALLDSLVEGKNRTRNLDYCADNKFYWIDVWYANFGDGWNHPHNLALVSPHSDDTMYAGFIRNLSHRHYFAIDDQVGPIVVTYSLVPDDKGDYCHVLWSDQGLRLFKISGALYNQLPNQEPKLRLRLVQKLLEKSFNVCPTTKMTLTSRESYSDELVAMEQSLHSTNYKFGVLYAKEGQTQNEMFGNNAPSPQFERFLELLGERVNLLGWKGFRGGLDVKHGHTGTESVFTKFGMVGDGKEIEFDIMFHVSTLLPYSDKDAQQLERKRHLGNDIVVIVFLEGDGQVPYDPNILKSEFNHAFIIVQPLAGDKGYRVNCIYKSGVPECNPFLPGPDYKFEHGSAFRSWLLAKCINSERVSCECVTFSQKLKRTRKLQVQMMVNSALEEEKAVRAAAVTPSNTCSSNSSSSNSSSSSSNTLNV